jgi:hypothetical protein
VIYASQAPQQPQRREYIKGMRLAIKLPDGRVKEIENDLIWNVISMDNTIPDYAPFTGFPIVVL